MGKRDRLGGKKEEMSFRFERESRHSSLLRNPKQRRFNARSRDQGVKAARLHGVTLSWGQGVSV